MRTVERNESAAVKYNLAAERISAVREFSGEIAHELKNPLSGIKGLAQLMQLDPARAPERLERLLDEVDRMRGILDEFLDFSRPLVPLTQEVVALRDLCRDVVAVHEGMARARHLRLVGPSSNAEVRCDPRKVKRIVVNLVQNAIEAGFDGGEVRIAIDCVDGFASVRVMDRGPGLSPAMADRGFAAGVTSKATGSGLGLTIACSLAEEHGGSLRLSNRDGGGCVAELLLPAGART